MHWVLFRELQDNAQTVYFLAILKQGIGLIQIFFPKKFYTN